MIVRQLMEISRSSSSDNQEERNITACFFHWLYSVLRFSTQKFRRPDWSTNNWCKIRLVYAGIKLSAIAAYCRIKAKGVGRFFDGSDCENISFHIVKGASSLPFARDDSVVQSSSSIFADHADHGLSLVIPGRLVPPGGGGHTEVERLGVRGHGRGGRSLRPGMDGGGL